MTTAVAGGSVQASQRCAYPTAALYVNRNHQGFKRGIYNSGGRLIALRFVYLVLKSN